MLAASTKLLGEEVEYAPSTVDSDPPPESFTVRGVWSAPHMAVSLGEGGEYSMTQPSLDVRLSDFTEEPKQTDLLTVFDTEYEVIDVQPDGQGAARLVLRSV